MKILFKDNYHVYYLNGNNLYYDVSFGFDPEIINNVKHLDDVEVICQYTYITDNKLYDVCYENIDAIIIKYLGCYYIASLKEGNYQKDYTPSNLNLL